MWPVLAVLAGRAIACSPVWPEVAFWLAPASDTAGVPTGAVIRVGITGLPSEEAAAQLRLVGPGDVEVPVERRAWMYRVDLVPTAPLRPSTAYVVQRLAGYSRGPDGSLVQEDDRPDVRLWFPLGRFETGTAPADPAPPVPEVLETALSYDQSTCDYGGIVRSKVRDPGGTGWVLELEERTHGVIGSVLVSVARERSYEEHAVQVNGRAPALADGAIEVRTILRGPTGATASAWRIVRPENEVARGRERSLPVAGALVAGPADGYAIGRQPPTPAGCASLRPEGPGGWPGAGSYGLLALDVSRGEPWVLSLSAVPPNAGSEAREQRVPWQVALPSGEVVASGLRMEREYAGGTMLHDDAVVAWFSGAIHERDPVPVVDAWPTDPSPRNDLPRYLAVARLGPDGATRWTRTVLATTRESLTALRVVADGSLALVTWEDASGLARIPGYAVVDLSDGRLLAHGTTLPGFAYGHTGRAVAAQGGWYQVWTGRQTDDPKDGVFLTRIERDGTAHPPLVLGRAQTENVDLLATDDGPVAAWLTHDAVWLARVTETGVARPMRVDGKSAPGPSRRRGPTLARLPDAVAVTWSTSDRPPVTVVVGDDGGITPPLVLDGFDASLLTVGWNGRAYAPHSERDPG